MKLIIIAGGKGTRLGFKDIPKPMVEVDKKPIIYHQIILAKKYGIKEIIILSGYLSEVIEDYFKNGEDLGVNITHVREEKPLGTAGSIKSIESLIDQDERFMVFYGDLIMDFNIQDFIEFDKKYQPIVGSLIVHPNDHPHDSDLLVVDNNNRVTNFISKPHNKKYYRNLVNAAVYIFSSKIFKFIEKDLSQDFGKDIFPNIVNNSKDNLLAYNTPEYIKDMGTTDRLSKVCKDFSSGKVAKLNKENKRKAIFLDRDGVINKNFSPFVDIEKFQLLDKVSDSIKKINSSDYLCIIITNQPAIAKGFINHEDLRLIHDKMETQISYSKAYIDGLYYCPHHPEKGWKGEVPSLKIKCSCRKPEIGMLIKAQKDYNIDLNNSYFIGDSESDMICGKNAGCSTISVGNDILKYADNKFNSLSDAINFILP